MVATTPPTQLDVLAEHLERLDGDGAIGQVAELVARRIPLAEVVTTILLPAWEQVDGRCARGELEGTTSGAVAAVARRALAAAVRRSAPPQPVPPAPGALAVVSPPGVPDLFGAEAIARLAALHGWAVEQLSSPSAVEELEAWTGLQQLRAVVVTAHGRTALPRLAAVVAATHRSGAPVLAWGRAFGSSEQRARRIGADAWAATAEAAAAVLERWKRHLPTPGPTARLPEAYREIERLRPALLAAAMAGEPADAQTEAWVRRAGETLVDHLGAAVGLGDPTILAEHLEQERHAVGQSELQDVHLVGLVDAIAAALPPEAATAREYISVAREDLRCALIGGGQPTRPEHLGTPRPAAGPVGADDLVDAPPAAGAPAGQAFADLLLLASFACQTPFAVLSVPQANGAWSTLSHGFEHRANLNEPVLFDLVASQADPVEIADLLAHPLLGRSAFARPPHGMRWVYATALRNGNGAVLGVIGVLDRWLREGGRREQRALQAVARRAAAQLAQVRRGGPPPVSVLPPTAARIGSLAAGRRGAARAEGQPLLRSHEVAVLFDVTERTVINWAASGKLPSLRTMGGHLRFRTEDVLEVLAGRSTAAAPGGG